MIFLTAALVQLIQANTLTFLFENEFNSTTSMAACRTSVDKVLESKFGFENFLTFSGKTPNNLGDMESCQKVAGGEYLLVQLSGEVYNSQLFSKGGKGFFFPQMTSLVGVCVPKFCALEELSFLKEYFYK